MITTELWHERRLGRLVGRSTAAAAVVGVISGSLFVAAADFHVDRILVPTEMLGASSSEAELFRWAALTDMLSYYLLLIPLFIAVGRMLRPAAGVVDVATVAGLMYSIMGAATAVVLAFAVPPLLEAHEAADPASREGVASAFKVLTDVTYRGVWQTLDPILVGVWAFGTGVVLRHLRPPLGAAGIGLGVIALAAALLRITAIDLRSGLLLAFAVVWAAAFWFYVVWLAIEVTRGSLVPSASQLEIEA